MNWYHLFQSQCWFRNTYLVNCHHDVQEKNNIYNSGCHFTCMSMMLNVNAAHLASELSKQYYFEKDSEGLVWDINNPSEVGGCIYIPFLFSSHGVVEDVKITLLEKVVLKTLRAAKEFISKNHEQGRHLICGNSTHSLLVAGVKGDDYFVWDPDTSWRNDEVELIKRNLDGCLTIPWVYQQYGVENRIEFWVYSVECFK